MRINAYIFASLIISMMACQKPESTEEIVADTTSLQQSVLQDFSIHIAQEIYNELSTRTETLYSNAQLLEENTSDDLLQICRQNWRDARYSWEHSEAFLFGPVSFENIDPRIDTWPVNFTDLELQLAGSEEFTPTYINGLQDALKGFHPIEYLLFGENGNKSADQFTARELQYLTALALDLRNLTAQLAIGWNPSVENNYSEKFTTAGQGSDIYGTKLAAYEELVNAMIGICEEVAEGKMGEPLLNQDPSLEESPFSSNSIADFTNNIQGVKAVYLGEFNTNAKGIEDIIRAHNLTLDGDVKFKIDQSILALNNITVPFGQAITEQPVQVQQAIDAILDLSEVLENEVLPIIQIHIQ